MLSVASGTNSIMIRLMIDILDFAGSDADLNEKESVVFFRDHLAFLDQVITEERIEKGLLDAAHALHDRQREFAERQGVPLMAMVGALTGQAGEQDGSAK